MPIRLTGCGSTLPPWDIFGTAREDTMQEQVKKVLDKIRPSLQADGGDVELVDIVDGVVKVRLKGACAGCPMSQLTLKNGIEKLLKREIPAVVAVEGV